MILDPSFAGLSGGRRNASKLLLPLLLAAQVLALTSHAALPRRLVLALDGVSYRDMKALQEGVTFNDAKGRQFHRQAFHKGYFAVSRLVSTFPSASDVAWTEVFGNRPLPGYQRTYFSAAANSEVSLNGVTTTMEYEKQMDWQVAGGFRRAMGYAHPFRAYRDELSKLVEDFLNTRSGESAYYALIRSTDDAQHMSGDILAMVCLLDEQLQSLSARYKAREGRDLEVLILSDHGNNHAGPAKRIEVRTCLKKAGYSIAKSIRNPKDVVLPTSGIESWVELHNSPGETESLLSLLSRLKGVDVLTAPVPGRTNLFIVMNSQGERGNIEWNPSMNTLRYSTEVGDPLDYRSVVLALAQKNQIDAAGFAPVNAWMLETFTRRYPLALERIVRGHIRGTLNQASILISLKNDYVHATWFLKHCSGLVRFGGTHGALDDLNSNGMLLSNFVPTRDTSASRVAGLFEGFQGLRDYRAAENGAELICQKGQSMITIMRGPLHWDRVNLPSKGAFLRIWTPAFTHLGLGAPVEVTLGKAQPFLTAQVRRGDPKSIDASEQHLTLDLADLLLDSRSYERVYSIRPASNLEPLKEYRISGRISDQNKSIQIFSFTFLTDGDGMPVAF